MPVDHSYGMGVEAQLTVAGWTQISWLGKQ